MANEIKDEDIPRFVRECWDRYRDATTDEREAEKESIGFWIGGKYQWREAEISKRVATKQPWLSINRCKPAVDQVENEARNNPPGPVALPVGGSGADGDAADIICGLIREYNYRSDGDTAGIVALRYGCAGGRGVYEMATEYADETSMEQQIVIKTATDPSLYFYDPNARAPNLEDAMWGGKVRRLSRQQIMEEYPGKELKIFDQNFISRTTAAVGGWMKEAWGWNNDAATLSEWTGGGKSGPYYICEFYRVTIKKTKLTLYSDNIHRFEDEKIPDGVTPKKESEDGAEITRMVPRRTVKKYVVTALDLIDKTDWYGTIVPYFWVLGPEIFRDGKRYRLSLITGAHDPQRGLNYTITSAATIVGAMSKTPFVGWLGQFDVANAQGRNPWTDGGVYAYMEIKPTWSINPTTGEGERDPAPERNTWEAPIERLMQMATFFTEQIKGATSVFFEPSLPSATNVQSGSAIKALQSQTNIGTINWQKQLQRAKWLEYSEAAIILPQIYDGYRVKTIVRPDSQHEIVEINKEFPTHEMENGKHRTKDGKLESTNNIKLGKFTLRVVAGPSTEERDDAAIQSLTDVIKIVPQLFANPAIAAKFVRIVGRGNPEVEDIADLLAPDPTQAATPDQIQAQLHQNQQRIQVLTAYAQKLEAALKSKLPEIQAKKEIAAIQAVAGIREAEIKAGVDRAEIDLEHLETMAGMAHESAMQAVDHSHESDMADKAAAATSLQSSQDAGEASAQSAQDSAQEPKEDDNG
jgi:hypothetical protein